MTKGRDKQIKHKNHTNKAEYKTQESGLRAEINWKLCFVCIIHAAKLHQKLQKKTNWTVVNFVNETEHATYALTQIPSPDRFQVS